jgi:endonuclease G
MRVLGFIAGLVALGVVAFDFPVQAQPVSSCPQHWLGGRPPMPDNARMLQGARELCATGFSNTHSATTRTGLWSGNRITAQSVQQGRELSAQMRASGQRARPDTFRPDDRLPANERAELRDYQGSGFDRGHIVPNADMPTAAMQDETFVLSNMFPQNPDNNRRLWSAVESAVRNLATRSGEVWVVTGVAFQGSQIRTLNNRVFIPSHVWKSVHIPSTGETGVYFAANDASLTYEIISLDELRRRTGIDAMPAVRQGRDRAARLPAPQMRQ